MLARERHREGKQESTSPPVPQQGMVVLQSLLLHFSLIWGTFAHGLCLFFRLPCPELEPHSRPWGILPAHVTTRPWASPTIVYF